MLLPVSSTAVLSLLILSFLCLGCWINMFKATGRWRFELFAIDFSVGAMAVVLAAALTLGTLGSDLAYSDRILVAGRTAQALAVVGGAVFNLGNMLLLASVSLLGISTAFPLTIGVALVVNSVFHFHSGNVVYLLLGIVIMLAAIVFEVRSARLHEVAVAAAAKKEAVAVATAPQVTTAAQPATSATVGARPSTAGMRTPRHHSSKGAKAPPRKRKVRKSLRGIVAAIIGGAALGLFGPILNNCMPGDLGLGPYGGMLLFGIGVLISTIVYDFYFLNITIDGSPLTFGAYLRGNLSQHLLGFAAGVLCVGGLLAAALAIAAPATADVSLFLQLFLPLLSVPLAFAFGITVWKEFATHSNLRVPALVGICLFTCSLAVLAFGISR